MRAPCRCKSKGVKIAGHNLANVNNPAYVRQQLNIQTAIGPQQGTSADAVSIQQMHRSLSFTEFFLPPSPFR